MISTDAEVWLIGLVEANSGDMVSSVGGATIESDATLREDDSDELYLPTRISDIWEDTVNLEPQYLRTIEILLSCSPKAPH